MKPTTLITGAGKRIGAALAEHFAAQGHNLVLHYRHSEEAAVALAAKLQSLYAVTVTLVQADLADPASLTDFWRGLPPVTTLIHNASHYTRDKIDSFTIESLRAHLAVNLESPLLLTQGFLAQLPADHSGSVIVLGDGGHHWSVSPEFFTYATSKHAWKSLIDLLAAACAPRARANVIDLAPTLEGAQDPEGLFTRLAERAPLKRNGSIPELAAAVDFLLASPGITGQTISLAAGMGLSTVRFQQP